jgi:hypothetical protein
MLQTVRAAFDRMAAARAEAEVAQAVRKSAPSGAELGSRMSAQCFIATLSDGSGYVLRVDGKVVSTHTTIAEAVKARSELETDTEARSA